MAKEIISKEKEERFLTHIPVLGWFFRRVKENREAIETALETGKKTKGEVKSKSFLGILGIKTKKAFQPLKLKRKNSK